ncbi:MAG: sugar O-acetyltransferase [Bacteroidota bacterium]|nr:sugar O-acetyltransferase [Bacteroidota bacterium]
MTEKEKMLKGLNYRTRDEALLEMYFNARHLLLEYNSMNARDLDKRENILSKLIGFIGNNIWIEAPFFCDYGENISIGDNSFINTNCIFLDSNKISIGKNALLGPYVQIYTASHPLKASDRIASEKDGQEYYLTSAKPVSIRNNVWIGGNTAIMPGVTIGDNVTIGAGSVITKDVPDNVLALGNPCKVIREL